MSLRVSHLCTRTSRVGAARPTSLSPTGGFGLQDIDFVLGQGERLAVVGANGSGKSTLLRALLGLVALQSGTVSFDDGGTDCADNVATLEGGVLQVDVDGVASAPDTQCPWPASGPGASGQRPAEVHFVDFAYVQQDPEAGFVCSSVFDEVAFGLCNLGLEPAVIQRCVREALEACGILYLSSRAVKHLSGGQKQLVSIASALALRPRVLLLDEAFCMLDEQCRKSARRALDASDPSMGIIEVTHDIADVAGYHTLIALRRGAVAWRGRPREFLGDPSLVQSLGIRAATDSQGTADCGFKPTAPCKKVPRISGALEVCDCSFSYGEHAATLSGVSLHVNPGELVAIVGRSGSGKTTCACLAAGLLKPQAGAVLCAGESIRPGDVGIAFQRVQDQVFRPTVLDDVMFGPLQKGRSPKEARQDAESALETVGLDVNAFGSINPHLLSGGEKRKVGLAGVLAVKTDFVILDEPTLGLDAAGMESLLRAVRALLAQGRGVLLVTHEPQAFLGLVNRAYELHEGRMRPVAMAPDAFGEPSEPKSVTAGGSVEDAAHARLAFEGASGQSGSRPRCASAVTPGPPSAGPQFSLNPIACLLLCAVCSVCALGLEAPAAIAVAWVLALALYRRVGGPLRDLGRALAILGVMYALVVISAALVFDGSADLRVLGDVGISVAGAGQGMLTVCRLALLVVLSLVLVRAYTSEELMDALQAILSPLGRIGVPVAEVSVMLSLAVRCIPLVGEKIAALALAQNARGANVGLSGNPVRKVLSYVPLLAPACIAMFRYAEDFAEALQTRGFSGACPTPLHRRPMRAGDWALALAVCACAVAAALLF